MQTFEISPTETGLHIEGFPDAVKFARVRGEKAHKLSDLCLHAADLRFAQQCLKSINEDAPTSFTQQALWRCAIVHFVKCFGEGVRKHLRPKIVYKDRHEEALKAQEYFFALRNKHIAHDVSVFASVEVGAAINPRDHQHRIAKVLCPTFQVDTLVDENFSNLSLLLEHALEWVNAEQDALCNSITADLEKEGYDALMARPDVVYMPPKTKDLWRGRAPPDD